MYSRFYLKESSDKARFYNYLTKRKIVLIILLKKLKKEEKRENQSDFLVFIGRMLLQYYHQILVEDLCYHMDKWIKHNRR